MIHIAVCDDDRKDAEEIRFMIGECCDKEESAYCSEIFEESVELIEEIERGTYFDIFLLDIEMPRLDGMELAARLRDYLPQAVVIFITFHEKYVYKSFEVQPYRFIPKSKMKRMLPSAIQAALRLAAEQEKEFYIVENRKILGKIPVKNILYVWHEGKYAYIEKTDGGNIKVRKTLKQVFDELPAGNFVWADRGCIVGSMQIDSIVGTEIILTNGKRISVSQDRIVSVKNQIKDYWMKRG